jgi:hypothetical protein
MYTIATLFVGCCAGLPERLAEAERARDDAVQKLDSHKRAAARSEREWELERQQLQVRLQWGAGLMALILWLGL